MDILFDILFELVFELVIEGTIELAGSKKVPLVIRIIAGTVVVGIYVWLVGGLFYIGISQKNWLIVAISFVVLLIVAFGFYKVYKKRIKGKK